MPLRRNLGFLGTVALSVGGMAPTLSMSVTGVQVVHPSAGGTARVSPRRLGLCLHRQDARSGRRFCRDLDAARHLHHVPAGLGARHGGVHASLPAPHGNRDSRDWLPIALILWALVWLLVWRGISLTARSVIAVEAVSLLLIAALIVVIFVRLGTGNAPGRQTLTPDVFKLPRGTGLAAVGFACTYGILSFGGFESSISAGEESCRPTEAIPRSVLAAVLFGTVFYAFCVSGQVLGFGAGPAGVARFARSTAPLGDLTLIYVGPAMAAVLSALGAALVGVAVASRTLYALARDRILASALATVSHQTGTPVGAAKASMTLKFPLLRAFALAGTGALDAFFYPVTTGAVSLLMAYALASVSVLRLYVLFCHLTPGPAPPHGLFPYLVEGLARARAHGRGRTPASQRRPRA
jgi:amino acid transporter